MQAALVSDPGNEDLLKLRADLEEVIALSTNLTTDVGVAAQISSFDETVPSSSSSSGASAGRDTTATGSRTSNREPPPHHWSVGDTCVAEWSEDKQW